MKKTLIAVVVGLVLTGCGGGGDDENPSIDQPGIENPKPEIEKPEPEVEQPSPEDNVGGSFEEPRPLNTVGGNNLITDDTGNNFYYIDLVKGDVIYLYLDTQQARSNTKYDQYIKSLSIFSGDSLTADVESLITTTYSSTVVYESDKVQRIIINAAIEGNLYASIDHCDKSKNKGVLGSPANPIKITQKDIDEAKEFTTSKNVLESYYVIDAKDDATYTFKTPIVYNSDESSEEWSMYQAQRTCEDYAAYDEEYGDSYYVGLSTDKGKTYNCKFKQTRGLSNGVFNLKYEIEDYYSDKIVSTTFKIIEESRPDIESPDTGNTGQLENNYGGTADSPAKISIKGNNIIELGEENNHFYIDVKAGDRLYLHAVLDTPYSEEWVKTCNANGGEGISIAGIDTVFLETSCTNTLIHDVTKDGTYFVRTAFDGAIAGNLYADIVRDGDPSTIGTLGRPSNPILVKFDEYYTLGRNQLNNYYFFETLTDDYKIPVIAYLDEHVNDWLVSDTHYKKLSFGVSEDSGFTYNKSLFSRIYAPYADTYIFTINYAKGDGTNYTGNFLVSEPEEIRPY
ncbi:hypothetical protein CTM88_18205 [Photobacterium aquimaris]|uniref:Uncharacterized protein n=1 Tax=Photobacterium aquimaris TaxID=512643 RepID=A0A2T3IFR7_9GAMM|nr:hypothetical protein [Photobacterium aquimaris]OBU16170.1 hypothetical protein AYY20_19835 [Photobacterium aquimaris]PSU25143.1 hypothetical protein CTM88_18205 [Photobacterium aquimaris]